MADDELNQLQEWITESVTASLAASSLLGAALGHDHATISLSDLHTPWDVIEQRLNAAADGDFVVALYNPRSKKRRAHLPRAMEILGARRSPDTLYRKKSCRGEISVTSTSRAACWSRYMAREHPPN